MSRRLHVAPPLVAGKRRIAGEDHHYLFRVLRLRIADTIVVFDGLGNEAVATIEQISGEEASITVGPVSNTPQGNQLKLSILVALIKGERMEWCIEKLTELGVSDIVPWTAARSVVKLDAQRSKRRHERFIAIAKSAARQCGGARLPRIHPICHLPEALAVVRDNECKYLAWEQLAADKISWQLPSARPNRIAVLTGPEGGLTGEEVQLAISQRFVPIGLGPCTLRAETAALAAVSMLTFAFNCGPDTL